jgi:hypothetical protein
MIRPTFRQQIALIVAGTFVYGISLIWVSHQWEAIAGVVLPAVTILWIVARENRLRQTGTQVASVSLATRLLLFAVIPGASIAVILFWFPSKRLGMNPLAAWSIASFGLALVLVKSYERLLRIRRQGADPC